jgi:hypothetical protein
LPIYAFSVDGLSELAEEDNDIAQIRVDHSVSVSVFIPKRHMAAFRDGHRASFRFRDGHRSSVC